MSILARERNEVFWVFRSSRKSLQQRELSPTYTAFPFNLRAFRNTHVENHCKCKDRKNSLYYYIRKANGSRSSADRTTVALSRLVIITRIARPA